MALIAMAVYDTAENKRTDLTRRTLLSLRKTVDFGKGHRLVISDNGSCMATQRLYELLREALPFSLIKNGKNLGTASAINQAWRMRMPGENAVKMDNDVEIEQAGWLDEVEEVFRKDPSIGICGLKRKDLEERPDHQNTWYHSTLRMLPHKPGEPWVVVEEVQHVMGTCQAYSWELLGQIGYLDQMEGIYGFDDALASLRAHLAGFKTVFLPHVRIDHIDPGGTDYTEWKKRYAGGSMSSYFLRRKEYESGSRPVYYEEEL